MKALPADKPWGSREQPSCSIAILLRYRETFAPRTQLYPDNSRLDIALGREILTPYVGRVCDSFGWSVFVRKTGKTAVVLLFLGFTPCWLGRPFTTAGNEGGYSAFPGLTSLSNDVWNMTLTTSGNQQAINFDTVYGNSNSALMARLNSVGSFVQWDFTFFDEFTVCHFFLIFLIYRLFHWICCFQISDNSTDCHI